MCRDLNPNHASLWTVRLHLTENASCILGELLGHLLHYLVQRLSPTLPISLSAETLLNFFQLCYRNGSVAEMLGRASLWDSTISGKQPENQCTAVGNHTRTSDFNSNAHQFGYITYSIYSVFIGEWSKPTYM